MVGSYFCATPKEAFAPHSVDLYNALNDVFGGNVTDPSKNPRDVEAFTQKVEQRMGYLRGVLKHPDACGITLKYALAALEEFYVLASVHSLKTKPLLDQKASGRITYDPLKEIGEVVKEHLVGTSLRDDRLKEHAIAVQTSLRRQIHVAKYLPDFVEGTSDLYERVNNVYAALRFQWDGIMRRIGKCSLKDFETVQTPSEKYVQEHLPEQRARRAVVL